MKAIRWRTKSSNAPASHSQHRRQPQYFRHAPRLRRRSHWTLRLVAVVILRQLPDAPAIVHVIDQRRQPLPRLLLRGFRMIVHTQVRLDKRADQPRPNRPVVIRLIAEPLCPRVASLVLRRGALERAQAEGCD